MPAAPVDRADVAALNARLYQLIFALRKWSPTIALAAAQVIDMKGGRTSAAANVAVSSTVIFTFVDRWTGHACATVAMTSRMANAAASSRGSVRASVELRASATEAVPMTATMYSRSCQRSRDIGYRRERASIENLILVE